LLDMLAVLGAVPEIERQLLLLAAGPLEAEARAVGAQVRVLPLPGALAALGESGAKASFPLLGLRGLRLLSEAVSYVRAFNRQLRELRPDVVHSNGMKAHLLTASLAPRQSRVVLHMHDFLGQRRVSRRLLRALCSREVTVAANSRAVADDCARALPRARVSLVYNAVDTAYFSPGRGEAGWLAELAGLAPPAPETTSFALVAAYARWKGQDVLLHAAARALALDPSMKARWYIVGGPIYQTSGDQFSRDELRALTHELGLGAHVGFVPFVRDVARVYRAADVIVHASSEREAFGRTIVEAMACRRPVIACRAGGAAELFVDGVTALGFEAGDAAGLASAMLRAAREPALASRLAAAGHEHARARFDRTRLGPELLTLYRNALDRGHR
jgi:glycosyltransferase involved in cell wall biosynthesis